MTSLFDVLKNIPEFIKIIVDQLYVSYYVINHFKSRQNYDSFITYGALEDIYKMFKGEENNAPAFDGADLEYFFVGNSSEFVNQSITFACIFVVRLVANIITVLTNKEVNEVADAIFPPIGTVITMVLVLIGESLLDVSLMISGYKVDVIKIDGKLILQNEDVWEYLKNYITNLGNTDKELEWELVDGEKKADGSKTQMRKYKLNTKENKAKKEFEKKMQVDGKVKFETAGFGIRDGMIVMDYNGYLLAMTLLMPIDMKTQRIGDLIEMHYRYDKDPNFKLSECYTYIGTDITADYSNQMPMMTGGSKIRVFPKIREMQMNGY